MSSRGGRRGGRGGGPLPRPVQVSKKISWLLRHGAEKEGLKLDAKGFVNVSEVLNNRNLKSLKVTFEELKEIVRENDKQRFTLIPISEQDGQEAEGEEQRDGHQSSLPSSNDPADYLIRANQGHSLKVESEALLQPITLENMPKAAVHGTTHAAWPLIVATGGLKPMGRTHVHFASGLPAGFTSIVESTQDGTAPVISGMRNSSTVLIYLNLRKALETGVNFWRSDNGVILSEGNDKGVVPLELFERVEDRTGEGILVQDGQIVKEAPASWTRGKGREK